MYLKIDYVLMDHPYKYEPSSKYEKWTQIRLNLCDKDCQIIKTIVNIQWDILILLERIRDNKEELLYPELPLKIENGSIAERIFALRGVDVPDIYMGRIKNRYTISLYDSSDQWDFDIQINEFMSEASLALEALTS